MDSKTILSLILSLISIFVSLGSLIFTLIRFQKYDKKIQILQYYDLIEKRKPYPYISSYFLNPFILEENSENLIQVERCEINNLNHVDNNWIERNPHTFGYTNFKNEPCLVWNRLNRYEPGFVYHRMNTIVFKNAAAPLNGFKIIKLLEYANKDSDPIEYTGIGTDYCLLLGDDKNAHNTYKINVSYIATNSEDSCILSEENYQSIDLLSTPIPKHLLRWEKIEIFIEVQNLETKKFQFIFELGYSDGKLYTVTKPYNSDETLKQ